MESSTATSMSDLGISGSDYDALPSAIRRRIERQVGDAVEKSDGQNTAAETQEAPSVDTGHQDSAVAATQTESQSNPGPDWRHKFDVLEGKYRAEVPRLHEENRSLRERIERMQAEFDALRSERQAKTESPAPTDSDLVAKASEYGFDPDTVEMFREIAKRAVEPDLKSARQMADQLKRDTANAEAARFYGELDRLAQGWRDTWGNPDFAQWLDDMNLRASLEAVTQRNDAPGIAYFINDFRKQATPAAAPAAKEKLKSMVEPDRARASTIPSDKPQLKRDDMRRIAHDFTKGRITEKEFEEKFRPYEDAEREGRLI